MIKIRAKRYAGPQAVTLTIGKTWLTLLTGGCHNERIRLRDIKTGMQPGQIHPTKTYCTWNAGCDTDTEEYSVTLSKRTIGCCTFDAENWAILMKAVKAAQKG